MMAKGEEKEMVEGREHGRWERSTA